MRTDKRKISGTNKVSRRRRVRPHWGKREPRLKGLVKVKTGKDKIGAWPLDCAGDFYRWTWGDKSRGIK